MKATAKTTSRSTSAKPLQRPRKLEKTGTLSQPQNTALLLLSKEAYAYQSARGRVEPGVTFNEWRREQVHDACGKGGLSKISGGDFKPVKIHFLKLSGREDEAFALELETGQKTYRPKDEGDTWEACKQRVWVMNQLLNKHAQVEVTHPDGHIHAGWLLDAARQRTRKPALTMETLAERLDPQTLTGLLAHLKTHIAIREGRRDPEQRAPRSYPAKPDPGDFTPDPF